MRVLVTGPGHSCTNWVKEIVKYSGRFNFLNITEDRGFFGRELPEHYGAKLATDNPGFTWTNLKGKMLEYPDLALIFCMRHPIDNCLSKIRRGLPISGDGSILYQWDYSWDSTMKGSVKALEFAYLLWTLIVEHFSDRMLTVLLEDLIIGTGSTIQEICRFLRVPFLPEMMDAHKTVHNKYQRKRYGGEIDPTQVSMYKRIDEIYDGFYSDKKELVEFIFKWATPIAKLWRYEI